MDKPGPAQKTASGRLAAINRAITTSLNFDEVLDTIVESTMHLVGARACVLLLVEKDGILRVRAARGAPPGFAREFTASMNEDAVRRLYDALVVAPDEALVSVPVIATNAVNGMLAVVREHPLDADEEWQLSALADQAAIALQNARLFEEPGRPQSRGGEHGEQHARRCRRGEQSFEQRAPPGIDRAPRRARRHGVDEIERAEQPRQRRRARRDEIVPRVVPRPRLVDLELVPHVNHDERQRKHRPHPNRAMYPARHAADEL